MKRIFPAIALLAWAALPLTGRSQAAAPAKPEPPAATTGAPQAATPPAGEKKEVERLVNEFDAKKQNLIEAHKAKLDQLKQARTEEERRRILAELRQLVQQRLEQQREIMRQMREQMQQTQRPNRPGG